MIFLNQYLIFIKWGKIKDISKSNKQSYNPVSNISKKKKKKKEKEKENDHLPSYISEFIRIFKTEFYVDKDIPDGE